MAQLKRIVCYAVNGSGLGHVTRLMAVARWIKRYVTFIEGRAPEVLFLTSTEATNVLAQNGFLAYKIPSKTLVKQNDFDPLEYRRLSKAFIWQVLGTFRPDLLVVDTFPAGSFNELFQILDGPFRKGFIFRHVKPEFARRPTFSAALRLYDVLAVPHRPEAAPVAPDGVATPLCCCGEVVGFDRHDALDRETARAELGVPEGDKLLYVSAGGGGDPESERIVRHFVSALESVEGLHLLVGAGPLYRGRQLGGPRLTWSSGPNVARYFPGCDAAISAGGYNTVHELMLFGVPSLLFAQEKIADDQAARIDALAALGAAIRIRDVDDGLALRRLVERALDPTEQRRLRQGARAYMPTNGAARCARALLTSSYDERQLGWAAECLSEPLVAQAERLGSAASVFYGQWLPRLLPAARAEGLESHPRFEALLQSLSADARREVLCRLEEEPRTAERAEIERALSGFLEKIEGHPAPAEVLLDLIGVAMKKYPLDQEPTRSWGPWVAALLDALSAVSALDVAGLRADERLQLFRIFPRIADCDCRTALAIFVALVERRAAEGDTATAIAGELRHLKLRNRHVQRAHFDGASEVLQ